MKRRLFKLALVTLAIVVVECTVFYTFIRQPILQQFRDTGEQRYIDAIATINVRNGEHVLDVPTAIPNAQAMYEQAVAEIDPDTLPKFTRKVFSAEMRHVECFYHVYCIKMWFDFGSNSKDYSRATLKIVGLRPLTHISRIFGPRAKHLDGLLIGKIIYIAKFSTDEETEWR